MAYNNNTDHLESVSDEVLKAMTSKDYSPFWHNNPIARFLIGFVRGMVLPYEWGLKGATMGVTGIWFGTIAIYKYITQEGNDTFIEIAQETTNRVSSSGTGKNIALFLAMAIPAIFLYWFVTLFVFTPTTLLGKFGVLSISFVPLFCLYDTKRPNQSIKSIVLTAWENGKNDVAREGVRRLEAYDRDRQKWQKVFNRLPAILDDSPLLAVKIADAIKNSDQKLEIKNRFVLSGKPEALHSILSYLEESVFINYDRFSLHKAMRYGVPHSIVNRLEVILDSSAVKSPDPNELKKFLIPRCEDYYMIDALIQSDLVDLTLEEGFKGVKKCNRGKIPPRAARFFKRKYGSNVFISNLI